MRARMTALMASLLALAGCASTPLVVPQGESAKYWAVDDPSSYMAEARPEGCFRARVTIDHEGKISDPKILAIVGSPEFKSWVPGLFSKLHYHSTVSNADRAPIQTTLEWTFHSTVAAAPPSAIEIEAMKKGGPSPESLKAGQACKAEMDKQMGITAAPAAATR